MLWWIRFVLYVLAGLGFMALVAVRLGELWPPLDLGSHFTPHILAVTLLLLAAGMAGRRWWVVVCLGVPILPLAAIVWGWVAHISVPVTPVAGQPLRVMAYKLWIANKTPDQIGQVIREAYPDIVVLSKILRVNRTVLDDLSDRYPYRVLCPTDYCSMAIASRRPFEVLGSRRDRDDPEFMDVRVRLPEGSVRVIGVHTVVPYYQDRHRRQIDALTELVKQDGGPTVVLGDFNATPFSLILRRFERGTGLERLTSFASWPSFHGLPQVAIDHIFVTPGIDVVNVSLGEAGGSDHYPVFGKLVIHQAGAASSPGG